MAKALENYTGIQPSDNQTVGLIAQMFVIIERMSKKMVSRDSKEGNKHKGIGEIKVLQGQKKAKVFWIYWLP